MRSHPRALIAIVLAVSSLAAGRGLPAAEEKKPAAGAAPPAGEKAAGAGKAAPAGDAEALFLSGQESFRKGQDAFEGRGPVADPAPFLAEAARSFEELVRRFPDDARTPDGALRLGTTYLLLDRMEKALAAYQRVLDSYPGFRDRDLALIRVGVCQAGLDDPAKAKATFERFLREFPDRKSEADKVAKYIRELSIVGRKAPRLAPSGWLNGMVGPEGLDAFQGQPIVLVFFATWCPNTRKELPHLRAILKKWAGSDVVPIGVVDPEDPQGTVPVETYVSTNKLEFLDVALDKGSRSLGPFRVTGFPAAALIDRKGVLRWRGHLAFFPNPLVQKVVGEREKP